MFLVKSDIFAMFLASACCVFYFNCGGDILFAVLM